jgi:neprilysin
MVANIQNEFKKILKEVDWMDKKSKENALEKADAIDIKIGYPEWILNDTELNDYYKNVL